MNTVFFQFASSPIHQCALFELIHQESLEKNKCFVFLWGKNTYFPSRMSANFQTLFTNAPLQTLKFLRRSSNDVEINFKIKFDQVWVEARYSNLKSQLSKANTLADLQNLEVSGVKPGSALANEIVTLTQDRNLSIRNNRSLILKMIRSYLEIYSATQSEISKNKIDRVLLFNGRFLHERAVWDASKDLNVEILLFETTRNRLHVRALGFHNRINNQKLIIEHWNNSDETIENKITESNIWFEEMNGKRNPFFTDTKVQSKRDKPFLVYFSNSDDEAIGFWDTWSENLGKQIDCVQNLQDIFAKQNKYDLIIRLHPNLLNKTDNEIKSWLNLSQKPNSEFIGPNERISSYELLEKSVGVITFGSTMGIQAAHALKPVLVLADCKYDELGIADKANSWEFVLNWINNLNDFSKDILVSRKEKSHAFGYFVRTGGRSFKYAQLFEKGWGAWGVQSFLGLNYHEYKILERPRTLKLRVKMFVARVANF
jgi:hypothetical protein